MATDVLATGADNDRDSPEPQFEPRPQHHSFFSVYKKGQGYWTRMGTALGALLLITVLCMFVYEQTSVLFADSFYTKVPEVGASPAELEAIRAQNRQGLEQSARTARTVAVVATAVVGAVATLFAWHQMNKPRNVDFLIATDVEMHKVNWTSRQELFGSTRVVIFFLFLIAAVLFLIDVAAGALFQWIGLLKFGPLGN